MNLTPSGRGREVDLSIDPALAIEPETACHVVENIFPAVLDPALFDDPRRIRALAAAVRLELHERTVEIRVGAGAEASWVSGPHYALRQPYLYALRCGRCPRYEVCHHILAAVLALLWDQPAYRTELSQSRWRKTLAPLMSRVAPPDAPAPDERPRGWIRATLHGLGWPAPSKATIPDVLSLHIMRSSKRSGRVLKPLLTPRSIDAIERKVRDVPPADRALCRLSEQRHLLRHVARHRYADSVNVQAELGRIDADLFSTLAQASELTYGAAPVTVSAEPWRPGIRITDADDGLALAWIDPPLQTYAAGGGWVLDNDLVLRPLDPAATAFLHLVANPLPGIPAADVPGFVREFLDRAPIQLLVETDALPVDRMTPEPRLVLRDDGGRLLVEPRFAYGAVEVARGGAALVRIDEADGARFVQRDLAAETALLGILDAALPSEPLEGEVAYDFLLDGLPQLGAFTLMMDPSLRVPVGGARASVGFKSGVDWFDVSVDFEVDGRAVPASAVLATWRAGRRYLELDDGTLARLPAQWLERHGEAAEELREMQRGRRGRLGTFAAPLAEALLDEAETVDPATLAPWREAAERLRTFDRIPERPLPPGVDATLRDYQHAGYRWLAALRDLGLGGVLADDMGLGKTLQTLVLLADTHRTPGRPSLVVAPTSVIHNWVAEARRFTPTLRAALFYGPNRGEVPTDVDVVVTSYALVRLDDGLRRPWRYVVLDEAQQIKNPASQVAKACQALDAAHRLALTGTPLENHLVELWSIVHFLMPGFFGSRAAFERRYATPIQKKGDADALAAMRRRLRPFILRRLKSEVASELPPRTEQVLYCELGPAQRRLYEQVRETYRDQVLQHVDVAGVERSTIQVLEALTRLRQACCHPQLLPFPEARKVTASAKLELLAELLDDMLAEDHRALVFSQWPSLLKFVAADLDARHIPYLYLDGGTRNRGDLQTRWNEPDGPPVFLISLKAGGTGMNLTGADHVVHLDPWWNPQAEAQATDRAHRIGQTRPVIVYKLVARDTAEEKILELQDRKRALFDAAVETDRLAVDAITRDDLVAVLGEPD